MGKAIVGMLSSYIGLQGRKEWLWQQTPHHFGIWNHIQLLPQAPNPDFLLLYNFHNFPKPPRPKRWFFAQRREQARYQQEREAFQATLRGVPKERVIFLLREPPLPEVVALNRSFYRRAIDFCGYISGPDDDAPNPDYMPAIWYLNNSFRELNEMGPPEKIKRLSWVTSGINRTETHQRRLDFLQSLRADGLELDLYGRNLPQWSQGFGEIKNKWHGLAPYYYNLVVENYVGNSWYVSEKLWDALLGWCLPIYYGGPAADKLLPPGSFIRLPSLDEKGLNFIKEVTATADAWHEAKDAIAEARQIILHKLNLLEWLSQFSQKFL